MKQIFEHYEKWEDYKAGMFTLSDIRDKHRKVFGAVLLLRNENKFYNTCKVLIKDWQVASEVNLTNNGQNRRAWLGAAACMYVHKTPEYLTRIAWNLLNKDEQDKANNVADRIIKEFESNINNNAKTLFDN